MPGTCQASLETEKTPCGRTSKWGGGVEKLRRKTADACDTVSVAGRRTEPGLLEQTPMPGANELAIACDVYRLALHGRRV